MKILLFTPINRTYVIMPSLGLGYLATQLRKRGHEVFILNCMKEGMSFKLFSEYINRNAFDVFGLQMYSYDLNSAKRHFEIIKNQKPSALTIAGGAHPSGAPKQTLEYIPQLDYAFRGEAELGFPLLLDLISAPTPKLSDFFEVPGLVWRKDDSVTVNPPGVISVLDELEFPSWDLLCPQDYPAAPHGAFSKNFPTAPIIISRGCPFKCTFCAGKSINGEGVRFRSIENVLEEMCYLNQDFGIREFLIEDENLTLHRDLTIEFCHKLMESKMVGISWSCPSGVRIDTLDSEILKLMESSGCYSLALGIEFGTQKMMDLTKKRLSIIQVKEKVELLRKTSIKSTGFFLLGVPGETKEDIQSTIKFALNLRLDRAQFNNYMPLPGSELGDEIIENQPLSSEDWDRLFVHDVAYTIPGLSKGDLKKLQRKAYVRFYLRPVIIYNLFREIKSIQHIVYLWKRFLDSLT